MSLHWISIVVGVLALCGSVLGLFRRDLVNRFAQLFPRSVVPAWILTALCCWMGTQEAMKMNMGFLNGYKQYIYFIAPVVFIASVVFMKELLAPRALGGFLILLAVPVVRTASLSGKPLFQVVVAVGYVWVVYGLVLLMSPWWFRKSYKPFLESPALYKGAAIGKALAGIALVLLGLFVY